MNGVEQGDDNVSYVINYLNYVKLDDLTTAVSKMNNSCGFVFAKDRLQRNGSSVAGSKSKAFFATFYGTQECDWSC